MISVRINMVLDVNDTYTWLFNTVEWAVINCPSFRPHKNTLEPYIVRDPTDLHYTFEFDNEQEATLFSLKQT